MANRPTDQVQGHWLLARLGKRVLRPGGKELTAKLLDAARIEGAAVVEFAPGLGKTAAWIVERGPASYTGVDADSDAAATVSAVVGDRGTTVTADASETGLPTASADVVIGDTVAVTRRDGATYRYRVDGTSVARFDASGIDPLTKNHELVLSTCWPLDAVTPGPMRYLVHATLIGGVAASANDTYHPD